MAIRRNTWESVCYPKKMQRYRLLVFDQLMSYPVVIFTEITFLCLSVTFPSFAKILLLFLKSQFNKIQYYLHSGAIKNKVKTMIFKTVIFKHINNSAL